MNFLEGKSKREKILISGLIISLVLSLYVITRVSNFNKEISNIEKDYKSDSRKLSKLKKETKGVEPSSKLEKSVKALKEKIKIEEQSLQGFDLKFVNLSNEAAVLEQISLITFTAEKNKLRILSKKNELKSLVSIMGDAITNIYAKKSSNNSSRKSKKTAVNNLLNSKVAQSNLQRRIFTLKLRGTFVSTYDFLKQIQQLEYGVLISKVSMTADEKNTYNGLRLVVTDITLAI